MNKSIHCSIALGNIINMKICFLFYMLNLKLVRMKNLIFTLLMICFVYGAIGAKRIAFIENPSFEPQVGLKTALTNEGYTVDVSYAPFDFAALAGYDLVIISRSVSSGAFTEYESWNSLNVPVVVLSGWCIRDSRLKLINSSVVANADGTKIDQSLVTNALPVVNSNGVYDSVFDGVSTGAAFPYAKWFYDYIDYYPANFQTDSNTGEVLSVLSDDATAGAGAVTMVRWKPGAEAYPGSGTLANYRTYMNIGADDDAGTSFNFDNYTDASLKLFLNEVAFLTTPKTASKHIAFLHNPQVPVMQVGLKEALENKGYTVDVSYTPFDFEALGTYDLIIVSKGISSSDFWDYESWNSLKAPVFVLSTFAARDSRMKLIQGSVVNPADAALIDSTLITNAVPIVNGDGSFDHVFDGVTTGASFPFYKWMYNYLDYSLDNWQADQNTGKPLVVLDTDASVGAGKVIMARWEPGTEAYPGSGVLSGRRSFMDIGTDDDAGNGYNYDNYTDVSLKLFLNEVELLMESSTVGVKDLKAESQLKVYPNPSINGKYTVEMKNSKSLSMNVKIYTVTGMQVYNQTFDSTGNININSGLGKGMYLMVVTDNNRSKFSQKIVIR